MLRNLILKSLIVLMSACLVASAGAAKKKKAQVIEPIDEVNVVIPASFDPVQQFTTKKGKTITEAPILISKINKTMENVLKQDPDMNPEVLRLALKSYACARLSGHSDQKTLTIFDFSKPSSQRRFYVIDLANQELLYDTYAAHGKGSGAGDKTEKFSNVPDSKKSSIGLYLTAGTYYGHNGISLRLYGLDKGFNDNAYKRYIVIHGAPYVSKKFMKSYGRIGHSWGCPAISQTLIKPIIERIKDGTYLFAYYPDEKWLLESDYLHCKLDIKKDEAFKLGKAPPRRAEEADDDDLDVEPVQKPSGVKDTIKNKIDPLFNFFSKDKDADDKPIVDDKGNEIVPPVYMGPDSGEGQDVKVDDGKPLLPDSDSTDSKSTP